ncbi:MAG: PASTA domain-containing protein, partial [Ruminococcus sp.]|nr:PASTA domain-containing protein [Ruminococcus sp.]
EHFKGYAAPEQYSASSSSRQGSWTDVYAVCALIYRALTGCMPVDSLSRMKHDDLLEPAKLDSKIPAHISRVIMDGMNLNGRDRIQTITELVTRLFEQPAPVEKAEPAPAPEAPPSHAAPEPYPAYQQPAYQQEPQPYQQQYYGAGYPNNYVNYRNNSDDDDSYHYEKVNTVDRIKVPIIIGVLLLAIFLIIAFVIIQILTGGDDGSSTRGSSASVTDNIISENQDSTFADIEQLDTVMPNLVDTFFDETKKTYEDKGLFKLEKISEYSDEYEYGLIMWQSVDEGEMINSTTTVKVKVSIGKKTAVIPEYSGYSVSVYSLRLKEAGIYEDNYSLVEDKKASGEPGNVSSLQYDNKSIKPGDTLDKSEGKKLIVYYVPSDAVQVATTSAAVTTAAPETTTTAAATTEAPVTTTQAVLTQPPETQPPVTQPPETQPIITEPIVTEPPQPITDENGQQYW